MTCALPTSISALLLLSLTTAVADTCPDSTGQRAAIEGYITAMQERRFDDAYDFVTPNMTDGRERVDWASMQKSAYERGEVDISGMDVRDARQHADDDGCDSRAIVPNILRSRDKLNEHGVVEFEIYYVVYDNGTWRIDSQETIFEQTLIGDLFPDVQLVDVGTVE